MRISISDMIVIDRLMADAVAAWKTTARVKRSPLRQEALLRMSGLIHAIIQMDASPGRWSATDAQVILHALGGTQQACRAVINETYAKAPVVLTEKTF